MSETASKIYSSFLGFQLDDLTQSIVKRNPQLMHINNVL